MFVDAELGKWKTIADHRKVWLKFAGTPTILVKQNVTILHMASVHRRKEFAWNKFSFTVIKAPNANDAFSTNARHAFVYATDTTFRATTCFTY